MKESHLVKTEEYHKASVERLMVFPVQETIG
jgi:hypothetical protein